MQHWMRQSALCYAAGTLGGLAKGGLIWLCGQAAITAAFADQLALALRPSGIYPRLVWAGLYALLFLLPFARSSLWLRGVLGAGAVSVLQLVVLPLMQSGSLHIFTFSTLSLIALNCVWGVVTAAALRLIE